MPKIEVVKQHDLKDCGACCVETLLKYYGGYVPLEKIRDDTCTSVNGTTAFHLVKALCSYGFDAIGVKAEHILDENIYLPAIAHVTLKNGLMHFVVIYKRNAKFVYIMDPAKGKIKMSINEFTEIWDHVLILATSPRTIRWARPSAIAVLPTPASPISTGLFLRLRDRMRITLRISESRPMTGSSLLARAASTRSWPYFFRAS